MASERAVTHAGSGSHSGQSRRQDAHNELDDCFPSFLFHGFFIQFLIFNFSLLIFHFRASIEAESCKDYALVELCSCFLSSHRLDECWPVGLREALHAAEACPAADVADVLCRAVLGGRCPAHDDVSDAVQLVLVPEGAKQAEGCAKSPLHALELAEGCPPPSLPAWGRRLGEFTFPERLASPNVQRIVIANSKRFHLKS